MAGISDVYASHDGLGLADLVRRREVKASELLDEAMARVHARNPALNAVIRTFQDLAAAAIEAGDPDGPFTGVPFLMKDLKAHVRGVPTTQGSRFWADAVPDHDSELTARYRRAGLVLFGKTNTPELGLNVSTEPVLFGPARNPWDHSLSTGGSSGGAAAAVVAGIVPAAHATDGAGSIRIPASCCGVFGLKPTRARTPVGPDLGESGSGMGAHHVVSRTVRDSAALLDATAGPAVGDPYVAPRPERSFLQEVGTPPGRLRIGFTTVAADGGPVHADCVSAVEQTARLCAELGHEVVEAAPSYDQDQLLSVLLTIGPANVAAAVDARAAVLGRTPTTDDLENLTLSWAERGRGASSADYARALQTMHRLGRQASAFFAEYDLFLTPTLAKPPVPIGTIATTDPELWWAENRTFTLYTLIWNATGQPAMSVPLHQTAAGIPIGVQFAARFGDESTLFRLAGQLETAAPWAHRTPAGY